MTVPRDLHADPLRAATPVAGALTIAKPPPLPGRCFACHSVSDDSICEPCRARIRDEALQHKLQNENVRV